MLTEGEVIVGKGMGRILIDNTHKSIQSEDWNYSVPDHYQQLTTSDRIKPTKSIAKSIDGVVLSSRIAQNRCL